MTDLTLGDLPLDVLAVIATMLDPVSRANFACASWVLRLAVNRGLTALSNWGLTEYIRSYSKETRQGVWDIPLWWTGSIQLEYVLDIPSWRMISLKWKGKRCFTLDYYSMANTLTLDSYHSYVNPNDEELPLMAAVLLSVMADKLGAVLRKASKKDFTKMLHVNDRDEQVYRMGKAPEGWSESLRQMFVEAHGHLLQKDECYGASMAPRPPSKRIHRGGG